MKITLIAFGKLKTPGLSETAEHYRKLLKSWAELHEVELKANPVPEKSPTLRTAIQKKEEELFVAEIPPKSALFLLDERGKSLTTAEWARTLDAVRSKPLAIGIGSSLGFSDDLRKRATKVLSLGPQTLAHPLARVVLLEQLYRALSVLHGHPYHNAD